MNGAEFILPSTEFTVQRVRLQCAHFPNGVTDSSRTVLCIPGYAATGESFARLRPVAEGWDLRLLTLPEGAWRHGESIDWFAGIVEEFARRFDHPVLLGTSFGGLVAMETAKRLGDRLCGLVLISTFARLSGGRSWLLAASPLLPLLEWAAGRSGSLGMRVVAGKGIDRHAARELWRQSKSISRPEKHARLVAALRCDLRDTASRIAAPVLIIHGSDDHLVPIGAARDLATLIPHAEMVEIAEASHVPYLTHAPAVNAALSRFLAHAFDVRRHAAASGDCDA